MAYYRRLQNPTSFRKLAAAMWRPPNDPTIFGSIDIDMTKALSLLEDYNRKYHAKVTITHLVVRAVAKALERYPEANAKIGWSKILLRNRIDIFCQVATDDGRDLSGTKIEGANALSLAELEQVLAGAARKIRRDQDPTFRRSRRLFKLLPLWGLRLTIGLLSLLTNKLSLHLPSLGLPRDAFGSAMVTSLGMAGVDTGYAPFTPIARCPIIITVTQVQRRPWVVGDRVEPRPVLRACATFDHRVIDGFFAGRLSTYADELLSQPEKLLSDKERAELGLQKEALEAAAL